MIVSCGNLSEWCPPPSTVTGWYNVSTRQSVEVTWAQAVIWQMEKLRPREDKWLVLVSKNKTNQPCTLWSREQDLGILRLCQEFFLPYYYSIFQLTLGLFLGQFSCSVNLESRWALHVAWGKKAKENVFLPNCSQQIQFRSLPECGQLIER